MGVGHMNEGKNNAEGKLCLPWLVLADNLFKGIPSLSSLM